MIVNQGNWCQASISTGNKDIKVACRTLRDMGYKVVSSSMGNQVTSLGILKLTMIDIRPGLNEDTFGATEILKMTVRELAA